MEFFDKKQDVIDLQVTRYGRQLLARGQFDPAYYCFSDDEVIYDNRWVSGTLHKEEQSYAEQRIQEETPRMRTLISKVGTEKTYFSGLQFGHAQAQLQNYIDLYNLGSDVQSLKKLQEIVGGELKSDPDFANSEKLMVNLLGSKRYFNNYAPAWNVVAYNGILSSSTDYYKKDNLLKLTPQLNVTLTDNFYAAPPGYDFFTEIPSLNNIIEKVDQTYVTQYMDIDVPPGEEADAFVEANSPDLDPQEFFYTEKSLEEAEILIEKDFLFISFEEANVDFGNENFMLEVFEVFEMPDKTDPNDLEKATEQLRQLVFYGESGAPGKYWGNPPWVESYFDVEVDAEIDEVLACTLINKDQKLKTKSIYNTDVYKCYEVDASGETSGNPYDLPPTHAEDVC
tara:strand:- start:7496 stop:8683 length:1188 start_codon:yes stop_codon:yes gene_type:complete